jgi:hypothetical protein
MRKYNIWFQLTNPSNSTVPHDHEPTNQTSNYINIFSLVSKVMKLLRFLTTCKQNPKKPRSYWTPKTRWLNTNLAILQLEGSLQIAYSKSHTQTYFVSVAPRVSHKAIGKEHLLALYCKTNHVLEQQKGMCSGTKKGMVREDNRHSMHANNVRNRSLSCISLSSSNPIMRLVITYSINAFENQFAYIKTRTALADGSEVANRGWASWDFVATFKRPSRISKLSTMTFSMCQDASSFLNECVRV